MKRNVKVFWHKAAQPLFWIPTALLVFVFVTWITEIFIEHHSRSWIAAIQVSVSLVLIAVTSAYVIFTSKMLRLQERQVRSGAQETAVRNLVMAVNNSPLVFGGPEEPIDISKWPNRLVVEDADEFYKLATTINGEAALLPTALYIQAQAVALKVINASMYLKLLIYACDQQQTDNDENDRDWSVELVKERWYRRTQDRAQSRPEWEQLVDGEFSKVARDAVQALRSSLIHSLHESE